MKIIIFLIVLIVGTNCNICEQPQKKFYMSYPTLSKRDSLTNLFAEVNKNMTNIESNYTDSDLSANFKILGLKAQAYYNDHHQTETYLDRLKVNVTMGDIVIASRFNYSIAYASNNKTGIIEAKSRLDPTYFTKDLTFQVGYLKWMPEIVPLLTFTQFFLVQYSQARLNDAQMQIFTKMLNNQAGTRKIKIQIVNQINVIYPSILKQHLNHEDLINPNSITYKYRNMQLNLYNNVKEFYMSNSQTKGLEAFLFYGLQSSTQNCTNLGKQFDQDEYGGFQEIVSFGVVKSMVKQALSKGLYDITLDKSWQVPSFQFYMGDLGNFVTFATYQPAGQRFNITCKYDPLGRNQELKVQRYDDQEVYVSVPMACELAYLGKAIISLKINAIIVAKLVVDEKSINVVVRATSSFGVSYKSVDENYKVDDQTLGRFYIEEVMKGLIGKSVFGSGFPTIYRKYPAVRIIEDRIIFFDPSEK